MSNNTQNIYLILIVLNFFFTGVNLVQGNFITALACFIAAIFFIYYYNRSRNK